MTERIYNFNPGPAALPLEVLEQAQAKFVEYNGRGISLMEVSHRSRDVEELNEETQSLLLKILNLRTGYHVLFMGGGASTQFALVPLNFLAKGKTAGYAITGSFAEKAFEEAKHVGSVEICSSSKDKAWSYIPSTEEFDLDSNLAYLHITVNNTIEGSQFDTLPDTLGVPLVGDMTSDILSRKRDLSRFSLMYAGAQKNLGPAGITVVIVKEDFLHQATEDIPNIFRYKTFAKNKSLYNTPPVHSLYMMNLVLKWVQEQGGIESLEQRNRKKAELIYKVIDRSGGFYKGIIEKPYRSIMNITWRMQDIDLEKRFVEESEGRGFEGLAGHRSVGGLRASAYNAVPYEACKALAEFMTDFQNRNG